MTEKNSLEPDQIIDGIYEAALIPEKWPLVLQHLSQFVDGFGASIFTTDFRQVPRWASSASMEQVFTDWVAENWIERAQRPRKLTQFQHAGFISEQHVFAPGEKEHDPEFIEFLKPRNLGIGTGTFIPMPTADVVIYSIERRLDQPPVSSEEIARLDSLRPHLARAGAIAVRLGIEKARSAADAFEVIGLPAATLTSRGVLVSGNSKFTPLIPAVFQDRHDRLRITNEAADKLFTQALSNTHAGDTKVKSIPIPILSERIPAHVLHLLPMKGAAHDIFQRTSWLAVAVPIRPGDVPGAEVLQALFDLTPAEARVARAIAQTNTLESLSQNFGVSRDTLKSQLRSVFLKTGTTRQGELIALLQGRAFNPESPR